MHSNSSKSNFSSFDPFSQKSPKHNNLTKLHIYHHQLMNYQHQHIPDNIHSIYIIHEPITMKVRKTQEGGVELCYLFLRFLLR